MANSRDTKGRWNPGSSGNPAGPPSTSKSLAQDIRDRSLQGKKLVDYLFSVLEDTSLPHNLRIQAANIILDRGWGKPTTEVDIQISARPLQQYSLAELEAMIKVLPDDGGPVALPATERELV